MAKLLILQHVPHERLGTFEAPLQSAGHELIPLKTYDAKAVWPSLEQVQGLVVMGGPMSVNQRAEYPF